jgi:hypothetical protein
MVRPCSNNVAHAIWDIDSCCGVYHLDCLPQRRIVILCSVFICVVSQFYDTLDPCLTNYNIAVFTLAFVSGALLVISVTLMLIVPDSAANTV